MFIEMDASQSGVQIAALLLRDEPTARLTNLCEGPPQDLYMEVVRLIPTHGAMKAIHDHPDGARSIVKRPCLAVMYGGGQRSIREALSEDGIHDPDVAKSLLEIVTGVMAPVSYIQQYFQDAVRSIFDSAHVDGSVDFRLPSDVLLAVPIQYQEQVLPHFDARAKIGSLTVNTSVAGITMETHRYDFGSMARQMAAGLIQSLDAYVLASTQAKLAAAGVAFHSKHDAFLIDRSHADFLMDAFRKSIYEVFQDDLMLQCHQNLMASYPAASIQYRVPRGSYDLADVLRSNPLSE